MSLSQGTEELILMVERDRPVKERFHRYGYSVPSDISQGLNDRNTQQHGIDGHPRKPYRMTDLLNLVGRLLKGE